MKPILSVRGPLQHPWIDQYRFVVGSNTLNTWDAKDSSLADAILEVREALECGYELNRGSSSGETVSVARQQHQLSSVDTTNAVRTVETSVSTADNPSTLARLLPSCLPNSRDCSG